ncbi:hypothetical protein NCPHL90_02015 [Corynebacterium diphtheriae]|nr:hypothetical protein NCPHL90_02015 [Corynebacterium diphtheriae]
MPRARFFYHQTRLDKPDKHAAVKHAILESFEANKHRYGYRRVLLDLRNKGWVVNHKLVYKLMHQMGLRAKIRQRRPYNSYTGTISRIADNKLARKFTPDKPNIVFVSDVTELRVAGRKSVFITGNGSLRPLYCRSLRGYITVDSIYRRFPHKGDCSLCAEVWMDDAHRSRLPVPAFNLA